MVVSVLLDLLGTQRIGFIWRVILQERSLLLTEREVDHEGVEVSQIV